MKWMTVVRMTVLASALGLDTCVLQAQETNEVEQLKQQLQQIREDFERTQREHRQQIEALTQKLEALTKQQAADAEKQKSEQEIAATPAKQQPAAESQPSSTSWSPTAPIRIGKAGSYVDVSLVATFAAGGSTAEDIEGGTELGGHDPNQRGFTVQGVEMNLQGAVDPYFRGNANIVFQPDSANETFVELEEAWLETISLPANLQVRAGQYLSEFGRINTQHPHTWAFVDTPLVNGRMFGEDGFEDAGGSSRVQAR